jgi:hypothetical protein
VNLQRGIAARSGEFLLFAVTPPRLTTSPPEAAEIARVTLERLRGLAIDGLVLYDIDDESDRNPDERPFPFLPTMDPADYLARDLARLEVPAIVYRAVGKYREDRFRSCATKCSRSCRWVGLRSLSDTRARATSTCG